MVPSMYIEHAIAYWLLKKVSIYLGRFLFLEGAFIQDYLGL